MAVSTTLAALLITRIVSFLLAFYVVVSTMSSIPVMYKPANAMETGLNGNNLQATAARRHPVDVLQRRAGK